MSQARFNHPTRNRKTFKIAEQSFAGSIRRIAARASVLLLLAAAPAMAEENWPTWRGPAVNGVSADGKPPISWNATTNIKWKVRIPGKGSSSPIVWGNKLFVETAVPAGAPENAEPSAGQAVQFTLLCIDRMTGKTIWQNVAREEIPHEGHQPNGTFASCSPITDGTHVYAFFGSRGLYCYDMEGKLKWSLDLGDMKTLLGFGEGSSPALHGEMLVINWDHEGESFVTALNKNTGQTIWKTPRPEKTTWATPVITDVGGQMQVIVPATGKIRAYNLADGQLIWECAGLTRNVIPTPIVRDGIVYCTSGFQGNSMMAIRLGKTGDLTGSDSIVWKYGRNTPYVPSAILVGDRIYCFAGNNPTLTSFDIATGKVIIDAQRLEALREVYASPVAADGKLYFVGRNGTTVVIKQSDTIEILATNVLDEKIDASPAVVGSEIYLRGMENLYCVSEK